MSGPQLPPPGDALEIWISAIVPPGALTWDTIVGEVPWTSPPKGIGNKPTPDQLDRVLTNAGIAQPAAREWVRLGAFTALMVSSPRELERNHGRPARAIAVAAEMDIRARRPEELADFLDLTDHRVPALSAEGEVLGDFRGLRRYRADGRQLLAAIGVWPWTTFDKGRLPREWWVHEKTVRAVESWRRTAWNRSLQRLGRSELVAHGYPLQRGLSIGEWDAAEAYRSSLHEVARQLADSIEDAEN